MQFDKNKIQKIGVMIGMLIYAGILYVFQLGSDYRCSVFGMWYDKSLACGASFGFRSGLFL